MLGRIPLDVPFLHGRVRPHRRIAGDDGGVLRRPVGEARISGLAYPTGFLATTAAGGNAGNQRPCCEYRPHLTPPKDVVVGKSSPLPCHPSGSWCGDLSHRARPAAGEARKFTPELV